MPKTMLTLKLERRSKQDPWGFVMIGGKDQSLTVKVGRIRPLSAAEEGGLKAGDYVWTINGKEVFEMSHGQCVEEVRRAGNSLTLVAER